METTRTNTNRTILGIASLLLTTVLHAQNVNWTWLGGDDSPTEAGVYSADPKPGNRYGAITWRDSNNLLWMFGGSGYESASLPNLNDLWRFDPSDSTWTILKGAGGVNEHGVYGSMGVPSTNNYPGGRRQGVSWIDLDGNLWLYGGLGLGDTGSSGYLSDLWRFNPSTFEWTWVSGSKYVNQTGSYGTQGTADTSNYPGGRYGLVSWTSNDGSLWLFGGWGYCPHGSGTLGDLWKFDVGTSQWTWMNGTDSLIQYGSYGTQGVSAPTNIPGARQGATSMTTPNGELWLFGGTGFGSSSQGFLNDLWKYNTSSGQWTWMSGNNSPNTAGTYGSQGITAASNVPGGRRHPVGHTDENGDLWIFGGYGKIVSGPNYYMNDLWFYDVSTEEWAWMKGSNSGIQYGNYGTMGIGAASNVPGSREAYTAWSDTSGAFWIFGGGGYANSGSVSYLSDLWNYSNSSGNWTWVAGDSTGFVTSDYSQPYPGSRYDFTEWKDHEGNFWIFGGYGNDINNSFGKLADLWKYDPIQNTWEFVHGTTTTNTYGTYGTQGIPASSNKPGSRTEAMSWTDTNGNLWLFGGYGYATPFNAGYLSDLWMFNTETLEWTWIGGSSSPSQSPYHGSQGTGTASTRPGARRASVSWQHPDGTFYLFGGYGYDVFGSGTLGFYNDVWKYDPSTNIWTWLKGSNTFNQSSSSGSSGVFNASYRPSARSSSTSWVDTSGVFWIYGGNGFSSLSDLWKYDPSLNQWAWVKGWGNSLSYYGPEGQEGSSYRPGSRRKAFGWADSSGYLWLFGGFGKDSVSISSDDLADLWRFNPSTGNWAYIKGYGALGQPGIYGSQGVPSPSNKPGGRSGHKGWISEDGIMWLFGGNGTGSNGSSFGPMQDLWKLEAVDCNMTVSFTAQSNVSCYGGSDGSLSATQSSGTAPFSYSWSNGTSLVDTSLSVSSIDSLGAGTYVITVEDAAGCTVIDSASITQPAALSMSFPSPTHVSCNGGNNGAATAAVAGGTPGYTYSWPGGGTGASQSSLTAGNYNVTLTDTNGCTFTATLTINEPTALTASISSQTNVSCNGGSDGSVTASSSGGTGSKSYAWSNGGTAATIGSLAAGSYTVTVNDANGCSATQTTSVSEPSALSISTSVTNVSCNGGNDGQVTATVSGGISAYSYAWSSGSTSSTATSLSAGSVSVTVTDINGCITTATASVNEPSALNVSLGSISNVSCNGGSDGSATATVSGGTSAYSFAWSAGGTSATNNALSAGSQSVTVTDANGCTASASTTISQPNVLSASISSQSNVSCHGGNDGTLTTTATGGTGSYAYAWTGGGSSASYSSFNAGSYTVTVTDANGCTSTASSTITQPTLLVIGIGSQSNVSCNGGNDGSLTATASGGTSSYSYLWAGGGTSATNTSLTAGSYSVTVTDANGCTSDTTVTITEPSLLVASVTSSTYVSCNGGNDGTATVSVSGGTSSYNYLWPGGGTSSTASGLSAGTYVATISDANGCTDTAGVTITEPTALIATITSVMGVSCYGGNDGLVSAGAVGGVGGYTYVWSNGGTSSSISNVSAGTYSLTVTDANGCDAVIDTTVSEPDLLLVSLNVTQPTCKYDADGILQAVVSGGSVPYTYDWASSQTSSSIASLGIGFYALTVTDDHGCNTDTAIDLEASSYLSASILLSEDALCFGDTSGFVSVSADSGLIPYTYAWSNGASTASTNVTAGEHEVTVTDSVGCISIDSTQIDQPDAIAINFESERVKCFGESNGAIEAIVTGGTSPYSYAWNDPSLQTTAEAVTLFAGTYIVSVTDSNGCLKIDSGEVAEGNPYPIPVIGNDTIVKNGDAILLDAGVYDEYLWNTGEEEATLLVESSGTYYVLVFDSLGCMGSDTIQITVWPTGLGEQTSSFIKLYPNPTRDYVTIENSQAWTGEVKLKLYGQGGQLVKALSFTGQEKRILLFLNDLPRGCYTLKTSDDSFTTNSTVILQ